VPLSLIILYGLVKKFDWAVGLFTKKIIFYSVFTFLLSMMPMLIYDTMHGYPQTLKFLAWIGYRLMVLVGFPSINAIPYISSETMLNFSLENYTQLIYPFNTFIAMSLLAAGAGYLLTCFKRRNKNIIVLAVLNILLMAELFLSKTPSSAYLPVMFPGLILVLAVLFNMIFEKNNVRAVLAPLFFILILFNCFYIISQVYFMKGDFGKRLSVAKYIVKESNGKEYNLKGREIGSQFETFTMNYEYLAWWLGNGPSHKPESLQFVISEVNNKFQVEKIEGKDQL
jgi:hypothetical protein